MSGYARYYHESRDTARASCAADLRGGMGAQRWRCSGVRAIGLALVLWIAGGLPAPALAQDIQILDLLANELIYDPVSQRIYASAPSAAGPEFGNTITAIDPFTGTIESSVFIGSEPGPLALSDDGQFLYVGLEGAGSIRRYDIATATPGLQFFLGSTWQDGWYAAEDIEVLPGNPHSIAVSRKSLEFSEPHRGIAVYDDDTMRPNTTLDTFPSFPNNRIEFSESASLLYGVTRSGDFWQISVTAEGAEETVGMQNLITRPIDTGIDIEFKEGVIYSTGGNVVDPVALMPLGRFGTEGSVEPDPARGKVFFLNGTTLQTFNLERFVLESSVPIYGIIGETGSLIRWGAEGLAFRTSGGQVFLISQHQPTPPGPVCEVELSHEQYCEGCTVIADSFRLINPTAETVSVEARLWFDRPGDDPYPLRGVLPAGAFDLPPGSDQEFGPVILVTVPAGLSRVPQYAFNCRLIDPVTADYLALDVNPFKI